MRSMKKELIAKLKGKMPKKAEEEASPLDIEVDESEDFPPMDDEFSPGAGMKKKGMMPMEPVEPEDAEMAPAPSAGLQDASDDDLLAELKKRGLAPVDEESDAAPIADEELMG